MNIQDLEKQANEAYLNSISLDLLYSTNPNVKTRTSEAKRMAYFEDKLKRAKFADECRQIESHLPDFSKLNIHEIECLADHGGILHLCPCAQGEPETIILHEDDMWFLATVLYSEDGWIAQATGIRITPKIVRILTEKGFITVEN